MKIDKTLAPVQSSFSKKIYAVIAKIIGPGIITGAADDDPSGVATYSIAGAQLGTSMLWTALLVVACDSRLMRGQPSSGLSRVVVAATTLAMFGAAIAMFVV